MSPGSAHSSPPQRITITRPNASYCSNPTTDFNAASTACDAGTRQYTDGSGNLLYLDADGNSTTTNTGSPYTYALSAYRETYSGNSASPRVSIGVGVNWNSPFGPLRIDVAKALLKQPGDDTKLVTFNIGGQF